MFFLHLRMVEKNVVNLDEKVSSVRTSQPASVGSTVGAALVIYSIQAISWRFMCCQAFYKNSPERYLFLWGKQSD